MKNLITTVSISALLAFGGYSQVGSNANIALNKGGNKLKNDVRTLDKALKKEGQYGKFEVGSGSSKVSFTVERDYPGKDLKTRLLKNKKEEVDGFCANDYFKTSGKVNKWNVFDEEGYSESSNIVPGAIFDVSKFSGSFFPAVEGHQRNPIRIVITNDQASNVTNKLVEKPNTASKIREVGVKPIRNTIRNTVSARRTVNSNFTRQYSESQMNISVGGSIPYFGSNVSFAGSTTNSNNEEVYTYIIEVQEEYYTLKADGNNVATKNFFVDQELNKTANWGYIESVTYGRKIYAVINSTYSLHDSDNSASVDFSSPAGDASLAASYASKKENESFDYTIYVMGGRSDAGFTEVAVDNGGINNLLASINSIISNNQNGPKFATPLSFVFKNINGDLIVSTYNPIESIVKSCNPTYEVRLNQIQATNISEGVGQTAMELYGDFKVTAYKDDGSVFYSTDALENKQKYGSDFGAKDGKTNFAFNKTPIKLKENEKHIFGMDKKGGGDRWQIPNTGVSGYFIFKITGREKDQTTSDDKGVYTSQKIYFTNLESINSMPFEINVDGNKAIFTFDIIRI